MKTDHQSYEKEPFNWKENTPQTSYITHSQTSPPYENLNFYKTDEF